MWYGGEYVSGVLFGEKPKTKEIINSLDYMGACNLGSLFLHNFVSNPFTKYVKIDYDTLRDTIHTSVRILDNIIDINKFPLKQFENYQKNVRTIGLGYTGIGDLLTMFNLVYGSQKSVKFIDDLSNFIAKESYKASIELAKEKGEFNFLDRERFVQGGFIQKHTKKDKEWQEIANDILKYGIRNARIISIAPTGTLSLTYGNNCSSGLEPIFSLEYDRKVKIGGQDDKDIQIIKMQDYAYGEWLKVKDNEECIVKKDIFVTAMSLSVEAHLNILSAIAFNTDMACSKTINIPTDYSFEDTKQVYDVCYKYGIKGCTIFRPNPLRQGILITTDNKSNDNDTKEETNIQEVLRGDWEELSDDIVYYPKKIYIGCGKIKLFIGWSEELQKIQDLYVVRSGNGGCEKNLQSTVIAMSGMLRLGGNIFNIEKAFAGLGGCNSFVSKRTKGDKLSKGSSCGTAMLNAIKEFMNEIKDNTIVIENTHIKFEPKEETKDIFNKKEVDFIKEHGEISFAQNFKKCPLCGEHLEYSGGCLTCESCGWSKCE